MPLCPLCAQCLVHADYRVRLWRLQWPAQYNIHSPDPAPTGHQPGAAWRGSGSYLKKGLSKFTYSPKLDLLSKLQTPSGSISAGWCRRAAGGWCVFLQLGAGPGLHCNLGKMKWYLLSVIVPPLPGHCPALAPTPASSIPDVFSVSTVQNILTLFTIACLVDM